jgi:hypothetical protein
MTDATSPPLTGLLLGAGASYEVGLPLVWDLTADMRREFAPDKLRRYNAKQRARGTGYPDHVIDSLAGVTVRDDMHYESMLGHIETQIRRNTHLRDDFQKYHGLRALFVEIIYRLLQARHISNVGPVVSRLRFYSGLAGLAAANAPLWIFSLNHDVVVECIAAAQALPLNCGFPSGVVTLPRRDGSGAKIGDLRAEYISSVDLKALDTRYFPPGTRGINLLKIHGGLDVFAFREGEEFLKILPTDPSPAGVLDALRVVNTEVYSPTIRRNRVHTVNEIAYEDDAGITQFLRRSIVAGAFKFDGRSQQILPNEFLAMFRVQIDRVSMLVSIGYGFGDSHINEVIRTWLERDATRRLEIVGPNEGAVPTGLVHLSPQITRTVATATEYLDRYAGIVRSRTDVLLKRLAQWTRDNPLREGEFQRFSAERLKAAMIASAGRGTDGLPLEEFRRRVAVEAAEALERDLEAFLADRDPKP